MKLFLEDEILSLSLMKPIGANMRIGTYHGVGTGIHGHSPCASGGNDVKKEHRPNAVARRDRRPG